MNDVSVIPEFKIKFSDVFSLRNLYIMMHETLIEEGWVGADGDPEGSDVETYYSENIYQKGAHKGGKEMWIYWRTWRFPGGRPNGYFKQFLDIDMHMAYMQNIEVVHQGQKMQAQKGEIELSFRPKIVGDWRGDWATHPLLKHFQHIYEKRLMVKEVDKQEKILWKDTYRVHNKIKQYLELRTWMPKGPPFWTPKYGFEGE